MYFFSIILIVGSNIFYNISQKSTPEKANPFTALLITYLTAALITVFVLIFSRPSEGLIQSLKHLNWTSLLLGISIVGLELGYLMAYRAGWNISVGTLVANIILALALIPIGINFYQEEFSWNKLLGAILCVSGLALLNLK
jgi:drug/metabolite transporter (DMT)-like permease